jgi:hypothetical protein
MGRFTTLAIPRRGRFELLWLAGGLAVALGIILLRVESVADATHRQMLYSTGANFSAGIAMLQAESRAKRRRDLNAQGYPTGVTGALRDDADCQFIWGEVMQPGAKATVSAFVADPDGSGDRCEFLFATRTSEVAVRIAYWPEGNATGVLVAQGHVVQVVPGTHVHVALD